MKRTLLVLFATILAVQGCSSNEKPTLPDGEGQISVVIVDTTGTFPGSTPGVPAVVAGANVSLQARTHEYVEVTDAETGILYAGMLFTLPLGVWLTGPRFELGPDGRMAVFNACAEPCPIERGMRIIGGKWSDSPQKRR